MQARKSSLPHQQPGGLAGDRAPLVLGHQARLEQLETRAELPIENI